MEDQLLEGGYVKSLFEFTNDIATYPYAVLKGPVPRKRKVMKYSDTGGLEPSEVVYSIFHKPDYLCTYISWPLFISYKFRDNVLKKCFAQFLDDSGVPIWGQKVSLA